MEIELNFEDNIDSRERTILKRLFDLAIDRTPNLVAAIQMANLMVDHSVNLERFKFGIENRNGFPWIYCIHKVLH